MDILVWIFAFSIPSILEFYVLIINIIFLTFIP